MELNDGYGSYICEYGHLHSYSKINFEELEKDRVIKTYNNIVTKTYILHMYVFVLC